MEDSEIFVKDVRNNAPTGISPDLSTVCTEIKFSLKNQTYLRRGRSCSYAGDSEVGKQPTPLPPAVTRC